MLFICLCVCVCTVVVVVVVVVVVYAMSEILLDLPIKYLCCVVKFLFTIFVDDVAWYECVCECVSVCVHEMSLGGFLYRCFCKFNERVFFTVLLFLFSSAAHK